MTLRHPQPSPTLAVLAVGLALTAGGCAGHDTPPPSAAGSDGPGRAALLIPPPPDPTPAGSPDPLERPPTTPAAAPGSPGDTARVWATAFTAAAAAGAGEPPAVLEAFTVPGRLPELLARLRPAPEGAPTLRGVHRDPADGSAVAELAWPAGPVWALRLTVDPAGHRWRVDAVSTGPVNPSR